MEWCRLLGQEGEVYEPLKEEPALFKIFAALDETEDAFLDFARTFGTLEDGGGKKPRYGSAHPDDFFMWVSAKRVLATAVGQWDGLKSGQASSVIQGMYETRPLGDMLGVYSCDSPMPWQDTVVDGLLWPARTPVIVMPTNSTERDIARSLLRQALNRSLDSHHVSLSLVATPQVYGAGLRLTYNVDTLIAAMWLQFALAVDGNRDYATCVVCGKPWDRTDARSHKKVCSDKCRAKKSYQERQKAKSQLEGKG